MNEICSPLDGINYAPDGASSGSPPSPESEHQVGIINLLSSIVSRDLSPGYSRRGYNYISNDVPEMVPYDQYLTERPEVIAWAGGARTQWDARAVDLGLNPDKGQEIITNALLFWFKAGESAADGKEARVSSVAAQIAELTNSIEASLEGIEGKERIALGVAENLVGHLSNKDNILKLKGEITLDDVKAMRENLRAAEQNRRVKEEREGELLRLKQEKEERFDEVVGIIMGEVTESQLVDLNRRAGAELLIGKAVTNLTGEDFTKKVLGDGLYASLQASLGIVDLSEYGDANYFYGAIEEARQSIKESSGSKQLQEWIVQTIEGLKQSTNPEQAVRTWIETMMEETDYCYFLGKYSDNMANILSQFPQDVNLETFKTKIKGLALRHGVSAKPLDMHLDWDTTRLAIDLLQPDTAQLPEYSMMRQLGMEQGRGIESYLLLGATQEIQRFASKLTAKERSEWEVRLVAKNIDGGRNAGLAQFYLGALMGDETTGPDVFAFADYMQFLRQAEAAKGYADPKDLQKLMEFRGPEVFEMLYRPIHERVEVLKEDGTSEWIEFDFRGVDVMAAIDNQEGWAELRVNEGLGVGSYNYAKGKWLTTALYQSMGVGTREDIKTWMDQEEKYDGMIAAAQTQSEIDNAKAYKDSWLNKPPQLGRIGLTSLSNQQCFEGVGGLVGANWWAINAAISTGRIFLDDVNYTPLETFERWSMTKVGRGFRSAYSTKYAKFPLSAQPCLDELALLPPMSDYVLQDSLLNPLIAMVQEDGIDDATLNRRKAILTEIIVVDQPVPDSALRFGEMAVGIGSCGLGDVSRLTDQQIVDAWAGKVDAAMQNVDVLGSTQLVRPWELWEKVAKRYSDAELNQVWGGLDWTPIAKKVMNQKELVQCKTNLWDGTNWVPVTNGLEGAAGFKNFLHYANYKLHYLPKLKNTRMDGFWRYRVPAEEDITSMAALVGTYAPAFHGSKDSSNELNRAVDPSMQGPRYVKYVEEQFSQGLQKLCSEMKLGTYTDKRMATQLTISAFKLYCMENMANNLDQTTFSIDTSQVDTPNQSFHASMITKDLLRERWSATLGARYSDVVFDEIVERLAQRGFRFVETKGNKAMPITSRKRDRGQVLLSPNGAYVPEVDTAAGVLGKLGAALSSPTLVVQGEVANRMKGKLIEQVQMMGKYGFYSLAVLKGGANTTPLLLLEKVIDTMSTDNLPAAAEEVLRDYIAGMVNKTSNSVYSGPYKIPIRISKQHGNTPANASFDISNVEFVK